MGNDDELFSDPDFEYEFESNPDPKVEEAKAKLRHFFLQNPEEVYFERQLEVMNEDRYFHWITSRALKELIAEGMIVSEAIPLVDQVHIMFLRNRNFRYWRRKAAEIIKLVRQYSSPSFLMGLGERAESLFDIALPTKGFIPVSENTRSYGGRDWTRTAHNLDRIFLRDGVAYGTEVKNTLPYIPRDELLLKLDMCDHLQLRPLFILRFAPKSYIELVRQRGGFTLIFKYQLYPYTAQEFAQRIRDRLGLPVDAPRRIAEGTVLRFLNWHLVHLSR